MDFAVQAQGYNNAAISTLSFECMSGLIVQAAPTSGSSTWPSDDLAFFYPFVVYSPITIARMFWLNGATSSGNLDVGIYDEYGNLLVSSGSTAQGTVSVIQDVDITDTFLQAGLYYMAMVFDNTTATIYRHAPGASVAGGAGALQMASAFPLPSTATFAVMATGFVPLFAVTTLTVV